MSSVADSIAQAVTEAAQFPLHTFFKVVAVEDVEGDAETEPSVRFLLKDGPDPNGKPVDDFTFFPENGEQVTYSFTLESEGAAFSAIPIEWAISPVQANGGPPLAVINGKTLSFTVPRPHHFRPWTFRLVVDFRGIVGIQSQTLFIALSTDELTFEVVYHSDSGDFTLRQQGGGPIGLTLVTELILIHLLPGSFNIQLVTEPPGGDEALFSHHALHWSAGRPPEWLDPEPLPDIDGIIPFQIPHLARGRSAGFSFAIEYKGLTILSPDPIIVNATIGDGTGG